MRLFKLPDGNFVGVNSGDRFDGWLFSPHPDGQLISIGKLEEYELDASETPAKLRRKQQ